MPKKKLCPFRKYQPTSVNSKTPQRETFAYCEKENCMAYIKGRCKLINERKH